MHSEHLDNLHPGWVVGGWLVAVTATFASFIGFVGLGLLPPDGARAVAWIYLSIGVGFFVGGLFVGLRWSDAPIIHGAAITFLSVSVWLVGSLALPETWGGGGTAMSASAILGLVLLQLGAAVGGGMLGRRMVRRGESPHLE